MKPTAALRALLLGSTLLAAPALHAARIYWDSNGTTSGLTDGLGVWLTAGQWWNGTTNVNWSDYTAPDAVFGNGGAGGAVTLASPTTVGSLTFNYFTGTYTIGTAGQAITLNSGITKDSGMGHYQGGAVGSVATIISPVILGNAQTWRNNSTDLQPKAALGSLNVTGGINLNGNALTIDGIGTTNLGNTANIISGGGGIIKNGTGVLLLGSAGTAPLNTYTGGTTINGGIVRFQAADIPGTSGSFGAGGITLNGGIIEGYSGNSFGGAGASTRSLGSTGSSIQILGGTSGFSGQGSAATSFTIGASGSTLQWGSTHFFPTGGVLVLQSDKVNANGKMTLNNAIDLNGATRTITSLGGDSTGGATVKFAITDSQNSGAGLNKTGFGNLILEGNNTYTGSTNVTGGSWINSNTTVAQGGWLTISGASGALSATSGISLNGATLQMINANTQSAVDRVNNAANFTVSNGGGITWNNASANSVAYAETLGTVSVSSGQFNTVLTNNQVGTGTSAQTLTLGGLSRSGSSTLTFSAGGTGPQASGGDNMIVVTGSGTTTGWSDGATSNSIIGAYATTGTAANAQTDYAVYNGSHVVAANTVDSAETTWTNSAKAYTTGVGGAVALTGTRTITALRNTGVSTVLTLASGADLRTTGILNGAATVLTIDPGTGGTVSSASGGDLYLTAGTGGITINANVSNAGGTTNIVKSGSGTVILNGANNTFGGNIVVNAGTLQVGQGNPATSVQLSGGTYNGNIYIAAGANFAMQGNGTNTLGGVISGDGNLNLMRGNTTLGNSNTYTGKTTLGLVTTNGNSNTVTISKFNSVFTDVGLGTVHSATSSLGAPVTVANGTIDFGGGVQQTVQINYTGNGEITDRVMNFFFNGTGTRVIDSSGGSNALLKFTSAAVSNGTTTGHITLQGSTNGEFAQGLGFAFTNLNKSGNGTWTLGGAVGSTGVLTVSGGTLALQQRSSLMGGLESNWTAAKINVKSGATLALNVDSTEAAGLNATSLNTLLTNISVAGTATQGLQSGAKLGLDTSTATGGTFTQGNAIANSTGANGGAIHLTKLGTGTLILDKTNTYTGATTVSAGTLLINGSTSSTSLVTVASGATLGGSGTVGGATTISGTHNPGNSPGIQTFGSDLTYSGVSPSPVVNWELTGNTVTNAANPDAIFDQIIVGGDLDFADLTTLNLSFIAAGSNVLWSDTFWSASQSWTLYDVTGTTSNFSNLSLSTINWLDSGSNAFNTARPGSSFSLSQSGEDVLINYNFVPVPEPRAALLGGLGLLMLLRRRRN